VASGGSDNGPSVNLDTPANVTYRLWLLGLDDLRTIQFQCLRVFSATDLGTPYNQPS